MCAILLTINLALIILSLMSVNPAISVTLYTQSTTSSGDIDLSLYVLACTIQIEISFYPCIVDDFTSFIPCCVLVLRWTHGNNISILP